MIRLSSLLTLTLFMFPVSAEAQTMLRWKFPVGRELVVEMTQNMKMSMDQGGRVMTNNMSNTSFMNWEVKSVDSATGVATIDSEIKRMKMKMVSPQGKVNIDSDEDKELEGMEKLVGEQLFAMVGKPFVQTMDERGQILTVDFPPEVQAALAVIGTDAMEKLIRSASPKFPVEAVSPGANWEQDSSTDMPGGLGAMLLKSTYTYRGKETINGKELAKLDIDIEMEFEASENSPGTINVTDQKTSGKMYFDAVNGHTDSMEIAQKMTMNIEFAGQEIVQEIENITSGTFKEVK